LLGNLEKELCNQAWNAVIDANEMLRTTFQWEKLANPVQIVLKKYLLQPVYYDLWVNDTGNTKKNLAAIKSIDRDMHFNLRDVPFRVTLCKTGENRWEMIISYHHILYDGWSNGIILAEFFNAYNSFALGKVWIKPLKTGFKEFIKRYHTRTTDLNVTEQENFWANYLAGIDAPTVLSLKKNNAVKAGIPKGNGNITFSFADDEKRTLEIFCKTHKITLASLFYCSWGIQLQKYNNRDEVIFGTTTAGRSGEIPGIEKMVGLFINTIPLRMTMNANTRMMSLLSYVNNDLQAREKFAHTALADMKKFSGLNTYEELFDSIVIVENYPLDNYLMVENDKLKVEAYSLFEMSHYDLTILVKLFAAVEVNFNFNREALDNDTAARLSNAFKALVLTIVKDPGQKVSEIDFLTETEKKKLLFDFNNTATDYPVNKTVHELFAEQVVRSPDHIALIARETREKHESFFARPICLSYGKLDEQSTRLAELLIVKSTGSNSIVGIMMERSIEMMIGIWGILKSGAAYLPIDPVYPQERIDFMLEDSGAKILINKSEIRNPQFETNFNDQKINVQNKGFEDLMVLDLENLDFEFVSNFDIRISDLNSSNIAYLIYTSGSTGKPKGVMIEHRHLVNFFQGISQKIDFLPGKTILAITTISFDIFVLETLLPLIRGLKVIIADEIQLQNPISLTGMIVRHDIQMLQLTPSRLQLLLGSGEETFSWLNWVTELLVGGEVFPVHLFGLLKKNYRGKLYNVYGPTETTVWSTLADLTGERKIGIGTPIANTFVFIVDRNGSLQPLDAPGELCIAGSSVARGYLNNPELTNERFIMPSATRGFFEKPPLDPEKLLFIY
ncbi:MAG TPA: AMP-binding protein, partial [Candidatus Kapabacteria bacterium]|nr:AMP-binding protein [Candidatus Kapabacteria bacterium]